MLRCTFVSVRYKSVVHKDKIYYIVYDSKNSLKCPLVGESLYKLGFNFVIGYCIAVKKNTEFQLINIEEWGK